jgi:DNA topoisomerase 2-associated protein PAT1
MKRDGSGFMTQREKEWVVKIQLLQLQGADPENDDYYYLNYVKRKAMKESAESASFSLALPQVSREEKNYQPVKFEQTLGKLSQSSLSAPRKMIDAPISLAGGGEGGGREVTTRKRQVLLIIEKLYSLVLALEDLDKRALVLPEVERGVVSTRKEEICSEIFDLLRLKTLEKAGK